MGELSPVNTQSLLYYIIFGPALFRINNAGSCSKHKHRKHGLPAAILINIKAEKLLLI